MTQQNDNTNADEYVANVYKLRDKKINDLISLFSKEQLSQYKTSEKMIEWILKSLFQNNDILGLPHWTLWRYQNGEWLERSILFNFGITRIFDDAVLSDNELMELANLSAITNMSQNNFASIAQAIKNEKTSLQGIYVTTGMMLYVFNNLPINVLKGILYFNKLYRPFCPTFTLNVPSPTKYYFFNRNGNHPYPVQTCSRRRFVDNKQAVVYRLQAQNYTRLN